MRVVVGHLSNVIGSDAIKFYRSLFWYDIFRLNSLGRIIRIVCVDLWVFTVVRLGHFFACGQFRHINYVKWLSWFGFRGFFFFVYCLAVVAVVYCRRWWARAWYGRGRSILYYFCCSGVPYSGFIREVGYVLFVTK